MYVCIYISMVDFEKGLRGNSKGGIEENVERL